MALHTGRYSLKSLEFYKILHRLRGLRQQTDLFFSTSRTPQLAKRARFIKDDENKLATKENVEKGISAKNSSGPVNSRPETKF